AARARPGRATASLDPRDRREPGPHACDSFATQPAPQARAGHSRLLVPSVSHPAAARRPDSARARAGVESPEVIVSWQPILVGAEADHAREIVATIAAELCAHVEAVGLDEPWMALLFSDRARVDGREQDARVAAWMEALAIDELAESALEPILHNGWVGTAFVLAQLAEQRGESADDERFAEIDAALLDELHGDHWYGRHDLIEGLAGIASYALERLPSPIAARCLTCVVEHLAATAETREVGLCWRTPGRHWPDLDQPARDDLGVAHGIAGVITVLARAHAAGIEPERCR